MRHFLFLTLTLSMLLALAVRGASPPNLDQALTTQRALATAYPDDSGVFNDLGNLQRLAGDLEAAEAAYRRALVVDPASVVARFNLAVLLQQKGKLGPALKELRAVLRQAPDHAWAYYQVGMIEDSQGNAERAINAYARAFSLDYELAFPEVNPHIIENRHVTAALLRSYRRGGGGLEAPNTYQEPARIAALLVPSMPSTPARDAAYDDQRMADEGMGEAERLDSRAGAQARAEEAGASGRVLSREDLEAQRALGQATPLRGRGNASRGGSRGSQYRGGTASTLNRGGRAEQPTSASSAGRRPTNRPAEPVTGFSVPGSQIQRPDSQNPAVRNPTAQNPANNGRGAGSSRPPGTRFRPGAGSTGRLDHRLMPVSPSANSGAERAG